MTLRPVANFGGRLLGGERLPPHRRLLRAHRVRTRPEQLQPPGDIRLGFGHIVVSKIELPNMLANMV
jgi:hypothetical protein